MLSFILYLLGRAEYSTPELLHFALVLLCSSVLPNVHNILSLQGSAEYGTPEVSPERPDLTLGKAECTDNTTQPCKQKTTSKVTVPGKYHRVCMYTVDLERKRALKIKGFSFSEIKRAKTFYKKMASTKWNYITIAELGHDWHPKQ